MPEPPRITKRTPSAPQVGERVSFRRTLTEVDAALFIGVTWDVNPYHTDEVFAAGTRFKRRIVPGLLTASMLTHLGGLWAYLATRMNFEFLAPVYFGDTILAEGEVVAIDERGRVTLSCRCTNQDGTEVLRGSCDGFPGRFEE